MPVYVLGSQCLDYRNWSVLCYHSKLAILLCNLNGYRLLYVIIMPKSNQFYMQCHTPGSHTVHHALTRLGGARKYNVILPVIIALAIMPMAAFAQSDFEILDADVVIENFDRISYGDDDLIMITFTVTNNDNISKPINTILFTAEDFYTPILSFELYSYFDIDVDSDDCPSYGIGDIRPGIPTTFTVCYIVPPGEESFLGVVNGKEVAIVRLPAKFLDIDVEIENFDRISYGDVDLIMMTLTVTNNANVIKEVVMTLNNDVVEPYYWIGYIDLYYYFDIDVDGNDCPPRFIEDIQPGIPRTFNVCFVIPPDVVEDALFILGRNDELAIIPLVGDSINCQTRPHLCVDLQASPTSESELAIEYAIYNPHIPQLILVMNQDVVLLDSSKIQLQIRGVPTSLAYTTIHSGGAVLSFSLHEYMISFVGDLTVIMEPRAIASSVTFEYNSQLEHEVIRVLITPKLPPPLQT